MSQASAKKNRLYEPTSLLSVGGYYNTVLYVENKQFPISLRDICRNIKNGRVSPHEYAACVKNLIELIKTFNYNSHGSKIECLIPIPSRYGTFEDIVTTVAKELHIAVDYCFERTDGMSFYDHKKEHPDLIKPEYVPIRYAEELIDCNFALIYSVVATGCTIHKAMMYTGCCPVFCLACDYDIYSAYHQKDAQFTKTPSAIEQDTARAWRAIENFRNRAEQRMVSIDNPSNPHFDQPHPVVQYELDNDGVAQNDYEVRVDTSEVHDTTNIQGWDGFHAGEGIRAQIEQPFTYAEPLTLERLRQVLQEVEDAALNRPNRRNQ